MIIKLTECRNINGVEKSNFDIYVNMDYFVTMNRSIKGRDTHMKLVNAFIFVKETPEEIINLMYSKPYQDCDTRAVTVPSKMMNAATKHMPERAIS